MLTTLVLLTLSSPPHAGCLTPQLLPLPPHRVPAHLAVPFALGDKLERDAIGTFPNELRSDNFVLKWGDGRSVASARAQTLIDAFEQGWQSEVIAMQHPQPVGSDSHLFNVYIGDTGSGTPPSYGAGGYFYLDDEGWPMIVINPDILSDGYGAESTAVHEFYHSIQHSSGAYAYDDIGAWFWEATATWVEGEIYPNDPVAAGFIGGFALKPQYPVDFFDYPDTGAFLEYHQYGAFIFPRYLSEMVADYTLIRDAWLTAGNEQDPLVVLDALLQPYATSLEAEVARFAAHNATWDYADAATYRDYVSMYAQYYPEEDNEVAAVHTGSAGNDWQTPPAATLPQRMAYNRITLEQPSMQHLAVAFEGDAAGSSGTPSRFAVTLVRELPGGVEYVELPLDGVAGELTLPGIQNDTAVHLVVAVTAETRRAGETFGYRYRLSEGTSIGPKPTPIPYLPKRPGDDGGCTAIPAGGAAAWGGLLVLGTLSRRRRRA